MATLQDVKLSVAGIAHVFTADVDTEPFDLAGFRFGTPATYGEWTWLGDISSENIIEFTPEGGEPTELRTHDRQGVRVIYSTQTLSGTINAVNLSGETFQLAFSGVTTDAVSGMIKVGTDAGSVSKAIFIVLVDDLGTSGIYLPNTSLKGTFPTLSLEQFTELPINVSVLGSLTETTDAGALRFGYFPPVTPTTT